MRDILFRGKRVDNGEWVQGCLHLEYEGVRDTLEEAIIIGKYAKTYNNAIHGCLKVDPDTISEYTGLKDKNGKKIFEGDIVKDKDIVHKGVVQVAGKTFEVRMSKGCCIIDNSDSWDFLGTCADCLTIIGNIYDNPELLEDRS